VLTPDPGDANAASPSVFAQLKPVTYACLLIGVVPGGISILEKSTNRAFPTPCYLAQSTARKTVDLYRTGSADPRFVKISRFRAREEAS
jgi:hypothetical protein